MRAAVIHRYGSPEVVRIAEVPKPKLRADEVLVRVEAAAVTTADARVRGARFPAGFALPARLMFGVFRPRRQVLGSSFSGTVEATGARVDGLTPGDEVCGMTGLKLGTHAEHVATPAKKVTRKPPEVSHEDAAGLLFGGTTALFFLRDKAKVAAGQSVLVNGASGAIGTNAIQLATHFGATVTAVTSTANADLVADLGAVRVVDYTKENLVDIGERFDVVLDAVGNLGLGPGRRLLTRHGVLLLAVAGLGETIRARGNAKTGAAPERVEDIDVLLSLVAEDDVRVVTDSVYDLDDVREAHARVDTGHKVGNVILRP